MREILLFNPVRKSPIWGTEDWVIAAHPKGDSTISAGKFAGWTLSALWLQHRELFGNLPGERFPLLIKEICARDNLSIQVHPDDAYAQKHENQPSGKSECWYILSCDHPSELILGHRAKNPQQAKSWIESGNWDEFLRTVPVHPNDFFQIDAGCVHALKGGITLLEIQQNSDITYRLYDYDRLCNGIPRPLHIQKSLDVMTYCKPVTAVPSLVLKNEQASLTTLIRNSHYQVDHLVLKGSLTQTQSHPFLCLSVVQGQGTLDDQPIQKGTHLLLPANYGEYNLQGDLVVLLSYLPQ